MALGAGVPVVPASIDRSRRRIAVGSPLVLSGEAGRDMEALRTSYAGTGGIHPERVGPVRLREEDALPEED